MPWTKQDADSATAKEIHHQSYYFKLVDDDGNPLVGDAAQIHVNVTVPEVDDDGVSIRRSKGTHNVDAILQAAGFTGPQRTTFLAGLKAIAAHQKNQ